MVPLGPAAPEGSVVAGDDVDGVADPVGARDFDGLVEHGLLDPEGWRGPLDAGTVVAGETTALDPVSDLVDRVGGNGRVVLVDVVVDDCATVVEEVVVVDAGMVVVVVAGGAAAEAPPGELLAPGCEVHAADGVPRGWVAPVLPEGLDDPLGEEEPLGLADPDDGYTTV